MEQAKVEEKPKHNYGYDRRLVAAVEYLITVQGIQSSQEIARRLNVSRSTVRNIRDMLGLGRNQLKEKYGYSPETRIQPKRRGRRKKQKKQSFIEYLLGAKK